MHVSYYNKLPKGAIVGTRLKKLDEGQFDAIILAAAGLKRLEEVARIHHYLEVDSWIPTMGQGAIGVECRAGDDAVLKWLSPLDHAPTRACVAAERAFNQALNGGCQLPIAAHAVCVRDQMRIQGFIANPDTFESVRGELAGSVDQPEKLGKALAKLLAP